MNDVCVIGGGPAGLAAAIALRTHGFTVSIIDARCPPIDKTCGEGLLPAACSALHRLGVDPAALPGVPLRGIRFHGYGSTVAGAFPRGAGRGVRRTVLHAALVERAKNCGAELHWNSPLSDFRTLRAKWIIGADGIQSRVRNWAGLAATSRDAVRFGFQRHYNLAPWSDHVEVYWSHRGQLYVTPVGENEIGVAALTRRRGCRFDSILQEFPALAARLGRGTATTERGSVTASRRLRRVAVGHVALIGDASGSVDAITGEGLALGFRQASLLADALHKNDLELYSKGHQRLARRAFLMGNLMLGIDRFPATQRFVLRTLSALPSVFGVLVGIHVGEPQNRETTPFLACYR